MERPKPVYDPYGFFTNSRPREARTTSSVAWSPAGVVGPVDSWIDVEGSAVDAPHWGYSEDVLNQSDESVTAAPKTTPDEAQRIVGQFTNGDRIAGK